MIHNKPLMVNHLAIAELEKYLSQQGNFCLLDWLLQQDLLSYSAYEAWRYGQQEFLESSFEIDQEKLLEFIAQTELQGRALGLVGEPHDYTAWISGGQKLLKASKTLSVHQGLTQHWLRANDVPQLDLFLDNTAVICENEIQANLAGRQFDAAQKKLQQLTQLNPKHVKLGSYQDLINYGSHMLASATINVESLAAEVNALEEEVVLLARDILGSNARDYIAFAWRRLGISAQGVAFNPLHPKLHVSYMLTQVPDWSAALLALAQEPSLFTSAALLQRFAMCHERLQNTSEALIAWCLLFECDANLAEVAVESKISPRLWALWEDFWDINDGGAKSFFPAFILVKNPGLVHHLHKFPRLSSSSTGAMIELLKVFMAGGEEIQSREAVQNISPALLRLYLNGRKSK